MRKHNQYKNIKAFEKKEMQSYKPSIIWIEPTNICNLRCKMCPQGLGSMKRKKGMMNIKLFKKIIDEVKEWKPHIKLFHMGESLLHPKIIEMIEYAHKKGHYTILNTNATMLDGCIAGQLIKSGLDSLSFSFDGATKKTYEKIRVGARFEPTLNNIEEFIRIKKGLKSKTPFVMVEIIKMEDTKKDIKDFVNYFNKLDIDRVRVKRFMNWAGEIKTGEPMTGKSCIHPWSFLVILWDGTIVPCCRDFDGKYILGNINKEKLEDIWNKNKPMMHLRKTLADGRYKQIPICRNCSEINTNWRGL